MESHTEHVNTLMLPIENALKIIISANDNTFKGAAYLYIGYNSAFSWSKVTHPPAATSAEALGFCNRSSFKLLLLCVSMAGNKQIHYVPIYATLSHLLQKDSLRKHILLFYVSNNVIHSTGNVGLPHLISILHPDWIIIWRGLFTTRRQILWRPSRVSAYLGIIVRACHMPFNTFSFWQRSREPVPEFPAYFRTPSQISVDW